MSENTRNTEVQELALHNFRKKIDANIKIAEAELKDSESESPDYRRCIALARTKLQEAKMWVGKGLGALGSELPEEYRDES